VIFLGGALVRHYFNLRNRGRNVIALPVVAAAILVALIFVTAPRAPERTRAATTASPVATGSVPASGGPAPSAAFADVRTIINTRCLACHAARTTHPTAPVAANGVMFDTPRQIGIWAPRIFERVVVSRTMPLGNLTQMTEPERAAVESWYRAGAHVD
jgi:uncharacterized membrane protein